MGRIDDGLYVRDCVDNVFARALGNFESECGFTVDARICSHVLERAFHNSNVTNLHDCIAVDLKRHLKNIRSGFKQTRNFDGKAASACVQGARRNK